VYLIFQESIDMYRMIGDISRPYRWSTTDSFVEVIPMDISEVSFFLICMVIGEQGCSQFW
jgi:hypothetical protein